MLLKCLAWKNEFGADSLTPSEKKIFGYTELQGKFCKTDEVNLIECKTMDFSS